MGLLETLESKMSKKELIDKAKKLSKIHNPYAMDYQVWQMLYSVLGEEYRFVLNNSKNNISVYKVLNDIIMKYCPGERILKYYLVKENLNKNDTITFFEMNVDNSRTDICSINGKSVVYEIKTEFDTTTRLKKQINDYMKVFEYIYIVSHKDHLEKIKSIVPEFCGIKTYNLKDGTCKFITKRKAKRNPNIDYSTQLRNLTSLDLKFILREMGEKNIPKTRLDREKILLSVSNERKINNMFKLAIKNRYRKQWGFIRENFNDILPMDIQSFFHSPIDPEILYSESMYLKAFEL